MIPTLSKASMPVVCSILLLCQLSCGLDSNEPSYLQAGTELTFKGKYLNEDGTPFANKIINFQNTRQYGYIDKGSAETEAILRDLGSLVLLSAFPLYPALLPKTNSEKDIYNKYTVLPGRQEDLLVTNEKGEFSKKILAEKLLKDANNNVNIVLVNEVENSKLFGKFVFNVKGKDTDLGELRLCSVGGVKVESSASSVKISWAAAPKTVKKYIVRVGDKLTNSLIWKQEVAAGTLELALPSGSLQDFQVLAAVEAFYEVGDNKTTSCLSQVVEYSLVGQAPPKSRSKKVVIPSIPFKVTSLTDGKTLNLPYLDAFNVQSLVLDFGAVTTFSNSLLYNLKTNRKATLLIQTSNDGITWSEGFSTGVVENFMNIAFPTETTTRFVKLVLTGDARISDLQEWAVF